MSSEPVRLANPDIEYVSIVDRAANKRRFAVIKRDQSGDSEDTALPTSADPDTIAKTEATPTPQPGSAVSPESPPVAVPTAPPIAVQGDATPQEGQDDNVDVDEIGAIVAEALEECDLEAVRGTQDALVPA